MALQISENNGTFQLAGNLNATTSRSFIIYFEHMINTLKNVKINIEKVNKIDANGVLALKILMAHALRNQRLFSIIGYGCKDIYEDFNYANVA